MNLSGQKVEEILLGDAAQALTHARVEWIYRIVYSGI